MKVYLKKLITEKGVDLDTVMTIEGHFGITYRMLINYIHQAKGCHKKVKKNFIEIDFRNGNVFHYFNYLAKCMSMSVGTKMHNR